MVPHSESARADVVVVGGGLTGCAAAYHLAAEGADVVLVERHDLNTQASGRNAGGLHGQIQHPSFLARGEDWARRFGELLPLLREAVSRWTELESELGADLEVQLKGGVVVASTEEQLRQLERKAAIETAHGSDVRLLGRDELLALAPYVAGDLAGGLHCPHEGTANPLLAAPAFARAAIARGARLQLQTEVRAIARTNGGYRVETSAGALACEQVLDCGGAVAGEVSALVGVPLPVEGEPIQVTVTEAVAPLVSHLVYYAGGKLTLKQARAGTLLIGGGWPALSGADGRLAPSAASLRENLRLACRVVPAVAAAQLVRTWPGAVNATPDELPVIGELPGAPGFTVAVFPYLGFTCGPLLGRIAAQLVLGRDPGYELAPYAPSRFA
jgi:glycine/D-amino acid oxidase-like deaminating enzyme